MEAKKTMKHETKISAGPTKKGRVAVSVVSAVTKPGRRRGVLSSIHETISGLHVAGVVKTETMREFDKLCLEPVEKLDARQIAQLRLREKVSQPVFAKYLNVSKSAVCQWESGEKNPDGAALKLLNIVKKKGLEVLA